MSQAKLCFSVLMLFLLSGLLLSLRGSAQFKPLSWDLKDETATILQYLSGSWASWIMHHVLAAKHLTQSSAPTTKKSPPLAADLSTCHKSLSRGHAPLYCCPPRRESDEPVIDFQFPVADEPKRIRRPAHLLANDEDYLAKYERAITIMKQYPYEDPFNWMRQANMHCIYCTGAYDQLNSTALFKIHRSWLFFPWHRIFIYFHERFIGKLIGDDTFALPYWQWDHPDGMAIPSFYLRGSFSDSKRQESHLPPTITDNNFHGIESELSSKDLIASNLAFMYHQMVSGAKKPELFMGCKRTFGDEGACNSPGTIEQAPHNTLHTWVGSPLNPERENMGSFYSAARDPIFYAHHGNIDRMWTIWKQMRDGEPEFLDPVWLDTYFYFHNENRQLVRVLIRDCLDIDKLGYAYEEAELPWLQARPKPSISPKIARDMLMMRASEHSNFNSNSVLLLSTNFSPDFGPQGKLLDGPVRAKVHRSPKRKYIASEEEEVLVIYGIDIKRDMYVKFDVFVNAIDELRLGPQHREFAGTFVNARDGARVVLEDGSSPAMGKVTLKLGISELLRDLEAEQEESIWVTLVPKGGSGINTTVGGVRIEYLV